MDRFMVRAAQSAFTQAGYNRADAYRNGQMVAASVLENLGDYRDAYGENDAVELTYRVARRLATFAPQGAESLSTQPAT